MEFDRFKELYEGRITQLEMELETLKSKLREGIELIQKEREAKGVPVGTFRIRLQEARVKPVKSFFDKISDDQALSFDNAFTLGHVRDLLGARLVCHNISDVLLIVDQLQRARWGDLHYVKPGKGDKLWIVTPQESGYRGAHVDVRWLRPGSQNDYSYAELQIRTLLQDAWANFMHDDVHKADAKLLLGEESYRHFRDMSNSSTRST